MLYTDNYKFKKPEYSEVADVNDINENADLIDSALKGLADKNTELEGDINSLAEVAKSGSYNDLSDKPTIGNGTLTIQKNSDEVGTFSANATSSKSINITVPTKVSELTNDSGFITSADGGNADTVDGKHISDIVAAQTQQIDANTTDFNTITTNGIYTVGGTNSVFSSDRHQPAGAYAWGTLVVFNSEQYALSQLYMPHSESCAWYRTSFNTDGTSFTDWQRMSDGGNADTVDGKHASEFIAKYRIGSDAENGGIASMNSITESGIYFAGWNSDFMPNNYPYTILAMQEGWGLTALAICSQKTDYPNDNVYVSARGTEDNGSTFQWSDWKKISDRGNASKLNGYSDSDFLKISSGVVRNTWEGSVQLQNTGTLYESTANAELEGVVNPEKCIIASVRYDAMYAYHTFAPAYIGTSSGVTRIFIRVMKIHEDSGMGQTTTGPVGAVSYRVIELY